MVKRLFLLLLGLMMLFATAQAAQDTVLAPLAWSFDPAPYAPDPARYYPNDRGYGDESIDVRIFNFKWEKSKIWAIRIRLTDASQLRTGLAGKYPGKKTQRVGDMASRFNAVLAINGDYFSFHDTGIVVRNGQTLRFRPNKNRDTLIIDDKGDFTILSPTTKEAYEALEGRVMHAFCFGPGLVIDGKVLEDVNHINLNLGKNKRTQRIALCQMGPLDYLVLACEGPENRGSKGLTLLQMAQLCKQMGCLNAYNLDGGSSATIALKGRKINALDSHKNRLVGDCIYFATLIPPAESVTAQ